MPDRRSLQILKTFTGATVFLILVLLTAVGVFDDFFSSIGPFVQDLLHDLNHQ